MKNKIQTLCYLCKKCNKTEYFQSDMKYNVYCKACGNEMQLLWKHDYKPNSGLNAIKNSNSKRISNSKNNTTNVPKCPTCGGTNVERISIGKKAVGGAMFGVLSSDIRNTMHCKNCGAKW